MSTSKSSTKQEVVSTTANQESSGIVGDVFQGADVTYTSQFTKEMADSFNKLMDFASGAGEKASNLVGEALQIVARRADASEQNAQTVIQGAQSSMTPTQSLVSLLLLPGVFLAAIYLWRKK